MWRQPPRKPHLLACRQRARLIAGALAMLIGLSGCASLVPQTMGLRDAWPTGVALHSENSDVPFFPQQAYQCGPAALATVLATTGTQVTPEDLVKLIYIPERQGSLQVEMLAAARRYGKVSYRLEPSFYALLREVAAGNPVIVLQQIGAGPLSEWHYAVVVGFDYPAGELYLRSGESRRLAMPFTVFEYTWKQGDYWAMVALPPERIPASASETAYLAAISAMERVAGSDAVLLAYSTFLARWPDNVAASIGLANRQYARGALRDAELSLRRAMVHRPDAVPLLNNLAQILSDMGRHDEALAFIEKAAQPIDSPFAAEVRETHALVLQRMGRDR